MVLTFTCLFLALFLWKTIHMTKYILILMAIFATACYSQKPITHEPSRNNTDYKVDYLFEHDGCKVYRFYDRGDYVYFTTCKGETIAKTDSTTQKNTTLVQH